MPASRCVGDMVVAAQQDAKRQRRDALAAVRTLQPWEEARAHMCRSALDVGFDLVEKIYAVFADLESDGTYRSAGQAALHQVFVYAFMRYIFGAGYNERRVCEKYGIRKIDTVQCLNVCTPRRWGKTACVSQFIYAVLCTLPRVEVAVFSPSEGQSRAVLDKVEAIFLEKNPAVKWKRSQCLITVWVGLADKRTCSAHSSNVKVRPFSRLSSPIALRILPWRRRYRGSRSLTAAPRRAWIRRCA